MISTLRLKGKLRLRRVVAASTVPLHVKHTIKTNYYKIMHF